MNIYKGHRESDRFGSFTIVTLNGQPIEGDFEWGYNGTYPGQLSKVILFNEFNEDLAELHHQEFKRRVISRLPENSWTLTSEQIQNTVKEIESETATS